MHDPAQIARLGEGLSEVMKDALVAICDRKGRRGLSAQQIAYDAGRRPSNNYRFAMDRAARSICDRGLGYWIRSRPDQWGIRLFYPNETGLAVRAHLTAAQEKK